MRDLLEIVGLGLLVAGACVLVGAAALVSTALAAGVAGTFLVFAGVVTVFLANAAAKSEEKAG